ncbi:MAG: hypothetical protein P8P30_06720 [Rickettsiales bacterium]|nr:hypothetical protein [Rickettsiales bacterium]
MNQSGDDAKRPNNNMKKSGFSLLELSMVLGIIALVLGMSLTVGDKHVEKENVRNSWNELQVIKKSLALFGERYGRLPCPAPIDAARATATYGVSPAAADCDATPPSGITHVAAPAMKIGAVPFKTLGLNEPMISDDWGNRYVYVVDDASITAFTADSTGVLTVNDRGSNPITTGAAFVVYTTGKTGRGGTDEDNLTTSACTAGYLDTANCDAATAGTYIDSSIRESDTDTLFYDDMLVWGKPDSIFNGTATIDPLEPPITGCVAGAGMVLNGINTVEYSGEIVSSAGDVNGDGFLDLLISAPKASPNAVSSGETYLVFGKASGWTTALELSSLDGTNGFTLNGLDFEDWSGSPASSAGDVNGDGYDDILIAAPPADPNGIDSGESYVVFGKASGWAAAFELSSLDGTTGFKLNGAAAGDGAGRAVSSAGDVNGDGYDDILIGAPGADPNGSSSGASYVVFGKASGWAAAFELSSLDGTTGFKLNGVTASDSSAFSVSAAGDVNTDGYDDILIGAPSAAPNGAGSGASYVVFGKASGWAAALELSSLDGTTGFKLNGIDAGDSSGISVSAVGDVNGDLYDDILIAAYRAAPNGVNSGESYVVFGKASGWAAALELSSLNGSNGFVLNGVAAGDSSGTFISSAGDVNGDGYDDIAIGAYQASPNGAGSGASYVVFGKAAGWAAAFELSGLDGTNGLVFNGIDAGDRSGISISSAGDMNNDGYSDLAIGATLADPNGAGSGQTHLLFGTSDWSTTSGVVELSAVTDPVECTSTSCPITVNIDLDGSAQETGWTFLNEDGKKILVGAYESPADDNSTESRAYALPNGAFTYTVTLTDKAEDGFASAGDKFELQDGSSTDILEKTGSAGFATCIGEIVTDSSCGFTTENGTTMLCGGQCEPITGVFLNGATAGDSSGIATSSVGDVNGDGYDDFIIAAYGASPNGATSGASHLIFGKASGWPADLDLSTLDGSDGVTINGVAADDRSGVAVSAAGDVNADGFGDFLIGAHLADPNGVESGATYLVFGKASAWAATLELSTLNGTTGVALNGAATQDRAGHAVSAAGDVNGDGNDDFLISAARAPGGTSNGTVYLVFGKTSGWASTFELSSLDGTTGFQVEGDNASDTIGVGVSGAGDINRDGYDDIIIGTPNTSPNGVQSGESFVIFGKASGWTASIAVSTLDGTNGFTLNGVAANDYSGYTVSAAGDVNADGFDDVLIAAPGAAPNGADSGASYLVFGKAGAWASTIELSALNGTTGVLFNGVALSDNSGHWLSSAGDVNGDGYDDMMIGAYGAAPNGAKSGASYLIFGKAAWASTVELSALNGTTGTVLNGIAANDSSGQSTSAAGDVNGDGYADILIGAQNASAGKVSNGQSYLIFGSPASFSAAHELSALDIPSTLCEGCSPACNSACNGTTWEQKACQAGTCTITNSVASSPKCAAIVDSCPVGAGFTLTGISALDSSGQSVASAGDVNGDNYADIIIGALQGDPLARADAGESYVVFGKKSGWTTSLDLGSLTGTEGFTLAGVTANDVSGLTVSSAGYVNGDIYADLIIGAPAADPGGDLSAGETYVVFGKGTAFGAILDLATLDGTTGFRLDGIDADDRSGTSVYNAGDMNGDGYDDMIIGSVGVNAGGDADAGAVYVVFGKGTAFASSLDLSTLDGTTGFRLDGIDINDFAGYSVASAGDINGDTYDDIIIGAVGADPGGDADAGEIYVVFGKGTAFASSLDLSTLNGTTGFRLDGIDPSDGAGYSVASAGDMNSDGYDDIIIGAHEADPGAISNAGEVYVVFGKGTAFASSLDLSTLNGTTGFQMDGLGVEFFTGHSVASAGDINDDTYDDIIIGAFKASHGGAGAGSAYVVFGKGTAFASSLDLSTLDGTTGFRLDGAALGNYAGYSVASAGDINGDTINDIIIGASGASPGGNNEAGESYVVFGSAKTWPATIDLGALEDPSTCKGGAGTPPPTPPVPPASCEVYMHYNLDGNAGENTITIEQGGDTVHTRTFADGESNNIGVIGPIEIDPVDIHEFIIGDTGLDGLDTGADNFTVSTAATVGAISLANTLSFKNGTASFGTCTGNFSVDGSCVRVGAGSAMSCSGTPPPTPCEVACGGSAFPSPGDVCVDGSVYFGRHPVSDVCMYKISTATPVGKFTTALSVAEPFTSTTDGVANTAALAGDAHTHPAASTCVAETSHAKSDWYSASIGELVVYQANYGSLPPVAEVLFNWSSNVGAIGGTAVVMQLGTGVQSDVVATTDYGIRCIRKDSDASVTCAQSCGGSTSPAPGALCTDGSTYAGVSPDGYKCMYISGIFMPGGVWKSTPVATGVTNDTTGYTNTYTLSGTYGDTLAANTCAGLTLFLKGDWYLPAAAELAIINTNAAALSLTVPTSYWSSSGSLSPTTSAISMLIPGGLVSSTSQASSLVGVCVRKDP